MFEFAISQHQKHRPSPRFIGSAATSISLHLALLLVLIENPHFLDTGIGRFFRAQFKTYPVEEKQWRPVAVLPTPGRMDLPPADVLRRVMYDWAKNQSKDGQPPIRVSWNDRQLAELAEAAKVSPPARSVPGFDEPPPAQPAGPPSGGGGAQEKPALVYLPPPSPDATPSRIPEKLAETPRTAPPQPDKADAAAAPPGAQAQVFSDRQAAIRSQGSGLFDTKGFPMGDYASMVIERVKSNWLIPSNLRDSQGSTTIVFYIARDGRFVDARIVVPSGTNSLDIAALSAVIGSNPFPPLPEGFPGQRVGAKFVFSYNERP
jgi:TonB family protein